MTEQMIAKAQAEQDVILMAERLAMLYYHFMNELAQRYGEDEAKEIARAVVDAYGAECGAATRANVEAQGLDNCLANHSRGRDLPSLGWQVESLKNEPQEKLAKTTYCPFASVWHRYGKPEWGRIYCYVDQAKYGAYNENLLCTTEKNLLEGCDHCLIRVREPQE